MHWVRTEEATQYSEVQVRTEEFTQIDLNLYAQDNSIFIKKVTKAIGVRNFETQLYCENINEIIVKAILMQNQVTMKEYFSSS